MSDRSILLRLHLSRAAKILLLLAALAATALATLVVMSAIADFWPRPHATPPGRLRMAILGDSNSHSYQDRVLLPQPNLRGGPNRAQTWQWTEVLDRLRGAYFDQGTMGIWGTRIKLAEALDWLGAGGRAPRKQDFRFNFAVTGAECEDLMTGYYRQAPRLLSVMRRDPDQWRDALVVIRIGVNSIGQPPALEQYARDGLTAAARGKIDGCVAAIRAAVDLIRHDFPTTRFILAGMLNGMNEPGAIHRWQTKPETDRIMEAVNRFDDGLRQIAHANPRFAFFDEQAWMRKHWGDRDAAGKPAYREVELAGGMKVTLTIGDAPNHAVVADEHAGTVWNALWAQQFITLLNAQFGTAIPPLSAEEIASVVNRPVNP